MKCFVALLALVALSHGYSLGYNRNMMVPTGWERDMYVDQDYLYTHESWPRQCEQVFHQLQVAGIIRGEDQIPNMVEEVMAVHHTILYPDQKIESIFKVLEHHGVLFTRETVPVIARCIFTVFCGQDNYPVYQLEQFFEICEQYGMKWDIEYAIYFVRNMLVKSKNLPVQYFQVLLHILQERYGVLNNEVVMCALRYVCRIHNDAVYPIQNLVRLFDRVEKLQNVHYDQQNLVAFFDQLNLIQKSISPIYKKVEQLVNFFQTLGVQQQEIVVPCVKLILDMTHDKNMIVHKQICQLLELLHAYGMPMKLYYVETILEHFLSERHAMVLPLTHEGIYGLLMVSETPFEIKKTLKEIEMNQFQYPTGFLYQGMPRDYFTHEYNTYGQGMWNQKYEHYPTVYGLNKYMGTYQYPQMWNQEYQHQTPYYQGWWQRMMMHRYPAMHQYAY